jgi:hypothetical protein
MREARGKRHTGSQRRSRAALAAVLPLVVPMLLAACSGGASQQIDDLSSNAAAVRLVAADRLAGSVPSLYASRLLAALANEAQTTANSLKSASLPGPLSSSAAAASNDLQAIIQNEQAAIEANDAPRLHAAMERAQALHERLQALSQQAEAAER